LRAQKVAKNAPLRKSPGRFAEIFQWGKQKNQASREMNEVKSEIAASSTLLAMTDQLGFPLGRE
jgi:hypothetical protein